MFHYCQSDNCAVEFRANTAPCGSRFRCDFKMAERPFGVFIIGESRLGKGVYDAVSREPGFKVTGVMSAPDDPIRNIAREAGIGSFGYIKRADAQFPDTLRGLGTDLVVLADTRATIPQPILEAGSVGYAVQGHNSLLGEFRGQSAANWPIYLGRLRSGFSIFGVTEELDGGDVAEQIMVPIGENDTAAGYYIGKIVPRTIGATIGVARLVADGTVVFVPQWALPYERTKAFEGRFEKEDGRVDFRNPSGQVHNEIRASDPTPAASAVVNGIPVDFFDSRIGEKTNAEPGTLVRIDVKLAAIATGDGLTVNLGRLRVADTVDKVPAHEFLMANGIGVGDRFQKITV